MKVPIASTVIVDYAVVRDHAGSALGKKELDKPVKVGPYVAKLEPANVLATEESFTISERESALHD